MFAALAAILLVAGCSEPEPAGAAQGAAPVEVEVVTLQTSSLALTTELPGRTTDYRQAEIRPQVSGILQQRLFTEGQLVEAGQLLYKIDAAPYQAALASAKANLASSKALAHNAKLKADRFKGLLGGKAVSQQDFDDAQATLMQADAAVASSAAALQSAQQHWPMQALRLVSLRRKDTDPISFRVKTTDEWHPNGRGVLQLNPLDNSVLFALPAAELALADRLRNSFYPLHLAAVGGTLYQLALLLTGVFSLALLLLGLMYSWQRIKARSARYDAY